MSTLVSDETPKILPDTDIQEQRLKGNRLSEDNEYILFLLLV
jgi:hypothetical protein